MAFPWFPWKKQETRSAAAADPSWAALQSHAPGGVAINARLAQNLSSVLACIEAVAGNIAGLSAFVFRRTEGGREIDRGHPLWRLIRTGPNRHQTWADFMHWLVASALSRGNGLAEIVTDDRGAVVELVPIPWEHVSVQLLPSGRLAYDISEINAIGGGTGRVRRLLEDQVLHLRDRSDDGLIGISRLQRAASVIQAGLSLQNFTTNLWDNGVNPSGALQLEYGVKDPEDFRVMKEHLREQWAGTRNAAKLLVLQPGMKWQQISVSPEDAELLASRRFTVEEIARLLPPRHRCRAALLLQHGN